MNLLAVGCSHRTAPLSLRERLASIRDLPTFLLDALRLRFDAEAIVLATCNRFELYLARSSCTLASGPFGQERWDADAAGQPFNVEAVASFLESCLPIRADELLPHLYAHQDEAAVRHLFRVVCGLDSMVLGEGQIAGQVKRAYDESRERGCAGPVLHDLCQHARLVSGRVRSETGVARGRVSVSSVAIDYVRQVFERFDDKTILVIGAGKMGEMTLRQLRRLNPLRILVANRTAARSAAMVQVPPVAFAPGAHAIPWERLDKALAEADIILSATGSAEPIISRERYERAMASRQSSRPVVILDIAMPRDFDPAIHDGDRTCLFNIDDLKRVRDQQLEERLRHVPAAEAIIEQELARFLGSQARRSHGTLIARLTQDFEAKRETIVRQLMSRLNGKLTEEDREYIEGAFRLLQNQILHSPIRALGEEPHETGRHALREALRKLFRLQD